MTSRALATLTSGAQSVTAVTRLVGARAGPNETVVNHVGSVRSGRVVRARVDHVLIVASVRTGRAVRARVEASVRSGRAVMVKVWGIVRCGRVVRLVRVLIVVRVPIVGIARIVRAGTATAGRATAAVETVLEVRDPNVIASLTGRVRRGNVKAHHAWTSQIFLRTSQPLTSIVMPGHA